MPSLYISPAGSGDKSGRDINNAASIGSLNTLIGRAGPGGEVLLLADQGDYNVTGILGITRGGTDGNPVTVRGIDSAGNPMQAQFSGSRPANWEAGDVAGNELFKLGTGASNLVFRDLKIDNVGTAFRATADLSNLTIEGVDANNVRRFFEDYASAPSGTATITGLTLRDIDVQGFSKTAIRLQYDTSNVLIDNVRADMAGQLGDDLPAGVHLDGTVHNVTLNKVVMENVQSTAGAYFNGDGFATERGAYDIRFIDTEARGNSDGGYDLKSNGTVLVRALSEENGRNFRLWGEATLIDPTGRNPVLRGGISEQNQLWLDTAANVTLIGGHFDDAGSRTKVISSSGKLILNGTEITHSELAILATQTSLPGLIGLGTIRETLTVDQGFASPGATSYLALLPLPATAAADILTGSTGDDIFLVDNAGDRITDAGTGIDRVETTLIGYTLGANIEDLIRRGAADFTGSGNALANTLIGGAGSDTLSGLEGNDVIAGNSGADILSGGNGEDLLQGEAGADSLLGGWQSDTLLGGSGADRLVGDQEWLSSQGANDQLDGGDDADLLIGDATNLYGSGKGGNDRLVGGSGNDILIGDGDVMKDDARGGNDTLEGGDGNDWLYGDGRDMTGTIAGGADKLYGGPGRDNLIGGGGNDLLVGGAGADWFVFAPGSGNDEISDFAASEGDHIDLSAFDIAYEQLSFTASSDGIRVGIGTDTIFVRGAQSLSPNDFVFG